MLEAKLPSKLEKSFNIAFIKIYSSVLEPKGSHNLIFLLL